MFKTLKQMDYWEVVFKTREEHVNSLNQIACAMKGTVCVSECHSCLWQHSIGSEKDGVWQHAIGLENDGVKVVCQPPVFWEQ